MIGDRIKKWLFHVWLTVRFVTSGRRLLNLPSMLSLIGMMIGVACMVVAMAVVSGFEAALKHAVQDVFGHVMVVKSGKGTETLEKTLDKIRSAAPQVRAFTPFVQLEAVLAHQKKISYIVVQGVEEKTVGDVLNIESRIVTGQFDFRSDAKGRPAALIGKGIARKFSLQPGSIFKVVLPSPRQTNSTGFDPKIGEFVVRAVLDLGKNEYDERYVVTSLSAAQEFSGVGDNFSGIRLRLEDPEHAPMVALALERAMGPGYFTMHWWQVNQTLFEAIAYEKPVLFFVLLMMVVAAAFNISSNLFVSVLRKFADISILRTLGFSQWDVMRVFTIQGLFFGLVGTVAGVLLGFLLCAGFVWIQKFVVLMPGDVYKLDHVGVDIRFYDLLKVIGAAFLISLLSTVIPAFRGSRLKPVEGLRYE